MGSSVSVVFLWWFDFNDDWIEPSDDSGVASMSLASVSCGSPRHAGEHTRPRVLVLAVSRQKVQTRYAGVPTHLLSPPHAYCDAMQAILQ